MHTVFESDPVTWDEPTFMMGHNSVTQRRVGEMPQWQVTSECCGTDKFCQGTYFPGIIRTKRTPTLMETLGLGNYNSEIAVNEWCTSITQYLAGNTNHPLVRKFGWGVNPRHKR